MLGLGYQVFPGFACFGGDDNSAFTLEFLAKAHPASNLSNNCQLFGFAYFKELGNPGQATGNILCFGGLTWNLGNSRTRCNLVSLINGNNRTHRQGVAGLMITTRQFLGPAPAIFN